MPAEKATPKDFKELQELLKEMKKGGTGLRFDNVEMATAEVRVYTDASFAKKPDISSQLEFVACLVDVQMWCVLLHWTSNKYRRVMKSTSSAEPFGSVLGYDYGLGMRHALSKILGRR